MKPVYICSRCGEEISRTVDECPHCGYHPQSIVWRVGVGALIFGAAAALVFPPVGLIGIFAGVLAVGGSYLLSPAG
ncbi:uncharacterized protein Nmag_1966 [Natrialba magadii ATCC 43099]|uniref:C2H2-type domain-containing protein n=1 Tax=Natrialba magadii (strain ATCC 43099 / DSM 3394 / CCM 3739 / CIP 104546 / IAM 13178 / JCM 8861 / NBRC 102185 / NCIMB 2190 / MS3) TaxID=547559 RepID=D3SVC9_NATMM|nr:zinc-ribbon domain-containing protein [Natrialba magadii]ADD05537.1 uncharacterized protein Nmag_1966 [Natrialba magadii ATCC 43099]ELY29501.1 hypothetical protein C500_10568 [Natrialba magadii ATCC 43099]